jgi:hypothetical protein
MLESPLFHCLPDFLAQGFPSLIKIGSHVLSPPILVFD